VFYAIFAILILRRMAGLVFLAVWLSATVLGFVIPMGVTRLPYPFHGAYTIEFFFGMIVVAVLTTHTVKQPLVWLATGVVLLGTGAVLEDLQYFDDCGPFDRFIYGIPSAIAVLGIAEADRQPLLRIPSLWRTLGSASYSIYLFQFVFIGLVWQGMLALGLDLRLPVAIQFILLTLFAVFGGIGMSRWVEHPLMKFVREHPVRGLVPTTKG
jgi:exopolysaccharide production protein ExoZ